MAIFSNYQIHELSHFHQIPLATILNEESLLFEALIGSYPQLHHHVKVAASLCADQAVFMDQDSDFSSHVEKRCSKLFSSRMFCELNTYIISILSESEKQNPFQVAKAAMIGKKFFQAQIDFLQEFYLKSVSLKNTFASCEKKEEFLFKITLIEKMEIKAELADEYERLKTHLSEDIRLLNPHSSSQFNPSFFFEAGAPDFTFNSSKSLRLLACISDFC